MVVPPKQKKKKLVPMVMPPTPTPSPPPFVCSSLTLEKKLVPMVFLGVTLICVMGAPPLAPASF